MTFNAIVILQIKKGSGSPTPDDHILFCRVLILLIGNHHNRPDKRVQCCKCSDNLFSIRDAPDGHAGCQKSQNRCNDKSDGFECVVLLIGHNLVLLDGKCAFLHEPAVRGLDVLNRKNGISVAELRMGFTVGFVGVDVLQLLIEVFLRVVNPID